MDLRRDQRKGFRFACHRVRYVASILSVGAALGKHQVNQGGRHRDRRVQHLKVRSYQKARQDGIVGWVGGLRYEEWQGTRWITHTEVEKERLREDDHRVRQLESYEDYQLHGV